MSISRAFLDRCAAETGYLPATLEKVVRLGEFAGDVGRHALLGEVLRLKGGTALNLCFGAPTRLSVDLDYNYVGELDREKMEATRPRIVAAVEQLAVRRDYRVQRSGDKHAGRTVFLRYRSVLGHEDRIEVDLNFLFRHPVGEQERRELWQPGGLDRPKVSVVSLSELWIGKFLALLDRAAARDAWDVARLPQSAMVVLTSGAFRARFIAMSAILVHPLYTYDKRRLVERVTERAVAEQLVPVLNVGEAPVAVRLTEEAWAVVGPLVSLTPTEREYVDGIQAGEALLDLLFPENPVEAAQLSEHPAVQWKILNAKENRAKRTGPGTLRPKNCRPTED